MMMKKAWTIAGATDRPNNSVLHRGVTYLPICQGSLRLMEMEIDSDLGGHYIHIVKETLPPCKRRSTMQKPPAFHSAA